VPAIFEPAAFVSVGASRRGVSMRSAMVRRRARIGEVCAQGMELVQLMQLAR
jgi:hypothetical protein